MPFRFMISSSFQGAQHALSNESLVTEVRLALVEVEEIGHYTGKTKGDQSCIHSLYSYRYLVTGCEKGRYCRNQMHVLALVDSGLPRTSEVKSRLHRQLREMTDFRVNIAVDEALQRPISARTSRSFEYVYLENGTQTCRSRISQTVFSTTSPHLIKAHPDVAWMSMLPKAIGYSQLTAYRASTKERIGDPATAASTRYAAFGYLFIYLFLSLHIYVSFRGLRGEHHNSPSKYSSWRSKHE